MKIKKYLNKEDIKKYFKYGPMEFEFKQAMFYYFIFEFPIFNILFWLLYLIKEV